MGLCTALCLASKGFDLLGVDIDKKKVDSLRGGKPTIYEKGVKPYLSQALSRGKTRFSDKFEVLAGCDLIFVTVGTPSLPSGGIDLSMVLSATRSIAKVISGDFPTVVIRSTVIPGTSAGRVRPILERYSKRRVGKDVGLCCNPEFLREGQAIEDTLHPHKIVIGAGDRRSTRRLVSFYESFYGRPVPPFILTDYSNAEMIKYSNNAFLSLKIGYINTIARICEKIEGGDVGIIAKGIGLDQRIGSSFLEAGPGFGGSCFPKDLDALIAFARTLTAEHRILRAIKELNEDQASHVAMMVRDALGAVRGKTVSVLGLAFKAGTDDVRDAASLRVIKHLLRMGARVKVYDPKAMSNARLFLGDKVGYGESMRECIRGAEACVLMTEWREFSRHKPDYFSRLMKRPVIVDARRLLNTGEFLGKVEYHRLGLGKAHPT